MARGKDTVAEVASTGGWLHVAGTASAPPDGSDVGEVIRWYRKREGLTQQEAAALLSTTQSRLSKLEKGTQALRDVDELRFIASKLSIPPERLGILPDHSADGVPSRGSVSSCRTGGQHPAADRHSASQCQRQLISL
jgi:transcriptional regulator with XRE-family HTH domain